MTFTPEEITAMAKEANAYANRMAVKLKDWPGLRDARFAELVAEKAAAQEREAWRSSLEPAFRGRMGSEQVREIVQSAIRARGQKGGV